MEIRNILKAAWYTPGLNGRWGLPILFEGPPGTGKSSEVRTEAHACGFRSYEEAGKRAYEAIIASIRSPEDFSGLAIPDDAGGIEHRAFAWAMRLFKAKRGVAFLDELNTAPPAVQAALLRVVLEGVVGDLELPPGIRFVAAQNRTEEAAGGWDLAPPLANRFGHLSWETPSVEAWTDWMLGGDNHKGAGIDAEAEEARVLSEWNEPFAKAKGLVVGFLKAKSDLLHKQPPMGNPAASKAWPSPRTWEMATRALAGSEVHGLSAIDSDELVAAFVGQGPAGELVEFVKKADLPNPADVLDGKVTFKQDNRLDRTAAVLASCTALVTPTNADKRKVRAGALWKLLGEVGKEAVDLVVPAVRAISQASKGQGKDLDLTRLPEAAPVILKLEPVLKAAGMMKKD